MRVECLRHKQGRVSVKGHLCAPASKGLNLKAAPGWYGRVFLLSSPYDRRRTHHQPSTRHAVPPPARFSHPVLRLSARSTPRVLVKDLSAI